MALVFVFLIVLVALALVSAKQMEQVFSQKKSSGKMKVDMAKAMKDLKKDQQEVRFFF